MASHEVVIETARWHCQTITPAARSDGTTALTVECETGERVPGTSKTIECSCGQTFDSVAAARDHLQTAMTGER